MILIFPNQLFKKITYNTNEWQNQDIYILEEPIFFGYRQSHMNFNKLKLLYHRASMKYYYDFLKDHHKLNKVHYIEFDDLIHNKYPSLNNKNNVVMTYDVVDHFLRQKLKKIYGNITYLENPNYIVTKQQLDTYYTTHKDSKPNHQHFYNWVKTQNPECEFLHKVKSYDHENRNGIPDNLEIPEQFKLTKKDNTYINNAKKYIETTFANNCGNTTNMMFPVTHESTNKLLKHFVKYRLSNFGTSY